MSLIMQEPRFYGLFLVISGGQCGADQGGLEAAAEMGVTTGGFAPKGWRTCRGPQPQLARFNLVESESPDYDFRTKQNIAKADGTVIIATNPDSSGSRLTAAYSKKVGKPVLGLNFASDTDDSTFDSMARRLSEFVIKNRIEVLNVAGNRDPHGSFLHHHAAHKIVSWALLDLHSKGLLTAEGLE